MVAALVELERTVSRWIEHTNGMTKTELEDETCTVLQDCLHDITRVLLNSDIESYRVRKLCNNIITTINLPHYPPNLDKRRLFKKSLFIELATMLCPGKPPISLTKGEPKVVMFIGLQGSGKTTTCTKYAYHYKNKKGWKAALVCADTVGADRAYDQLKQKADEAQIPFYGSCTESDPIEIALKGVERFKKDNYELIVLDTGWPDMRSDSKAPLFEEMHRVYKAVKPDLVILVMGISRRRAVFGLAQAFERTFPNKGAVIVTKLDRHPKGGRVLCALAEAKSSVIFLSNNNEEDLVEFDVKPFVGRLVGSDDWWKEFLRSNVSDVLPYSEKLWQQLREKRFTLRMMYHVCQDFIHRGMLSQMSSLCFRRTDLLYCRVEVKTRLSLYVTIIESMTDAELDCANPTESIMMSEPLMLKVARQSRRSIGDVQEMLRQLKFIGSRIYTDKKKCR